MSYDGKIMRRASARFDADRRRREEAFRRRQEQTYARAPRLREIDAELTSTMSRIIVSALRKGSDPRPAVAVLRDGNLSLQQERTQLLADLGLSPDYLEYKPACPLCGDAGTKGEAACVCLKRYYAQEQQAELSRSLDLAGQSFDTFSMDWYDQTPDPVYGISPRENMETVYEVCANYAHAFKKHGGNLLLYGKPGLGKTFLSSAIAGEVSAAGFSVVYDTASHVFSRFEDRKFGRDEGEGVEEDVERIMHCDLLILDDLGTEMTTSFVQSALYEIVNTRLLECRSVILNTNLSPEELARRYGAQIGSRLEGEYQILPFFGRDIRRLKKERG
ncbi:ATP-binding protein [uncultured Oscillibacter sp.]|uniref:ATP-binding protein n=1 Tax=uncultured Oscillibacter sp. TaxID=876091 RepID=UPI0025E795DE|nr:ATP-binding protein [uncultured Oscillibacter sp.]